MTVSVAVLAFDPRRGDFGFVGELLGSALCLFQGSFEPVGAVSVAKLAEFLDCVLKGLDDTGLDALPERLGFGGEGDLDG